MSANPTFSSKRPVFSSPRTALPYTGIRTQPERMADARWDRVVVSCDKCGYKKRIARARTLNGNPGEHCGLVLTIGEE